MIRNVKLRNIGSIKNEASFDFSKSRIDFKENMIKGDLVNPIAMFGTNGSGKTVFLRAINKLSQFMYEDLNKVHIFPYLGESTNDESSHIKIEGVLKNVEYSYELVYAIDSIVEEKIFFNNYEIIRKNNEYTINSKLIPINIEGGKYSVVKLLGLQEHDVDELRFLNYFYEYLRDIVFIDSRGDVDSYYNNLDEILVEYSNEVNKLLTSYEHFPQYELEFKENELTHKKEVVFGLEGQEKLPKSFMSSGMKSHSILLSLLLKLKDSETLFLIDELERNLHSFVSKRLIVNFNKSFENIQMIFASHNTNLLQHLRPDQIFFSNYNKDEKSFYMKLSDSYKDIREVNNIEKMYYNRKFNV